ncbi:hypothetical protein Tco_1502254 [Tanacetum coccineum]
MSMEALQAQEDLMKSIEASSKSLIVSLLVENAKGPVNSLNYGGMSIFAQFRPTASDEFLKSSVEILVPNPKLQYKGVSTQCCDVYICCPFHNNSRLLTCSKDQSEDFSDSNVDSASTDEDSFSSNDVEFPLTIDNLSFPLPCCHVVVVVICPGLPDCDRLSSFGIHQEKWDINKKTGKPSQNDKTEHGMEKTVQNQGKFKNVKVEAITEDISKSTVLGT